MTRTLQISAIVLSLIFNINQSHAQSGAVVNYRDILLGAFPDTTRLSTWMAYVDENLEELVNGGIDQTARDSIAAHRSNIDALYGLIGPGADSVRAAHTADTVTAILPVAQIAGIDSGDFAKVSLLDTYAVDSARAAFKADTVTGDLSKEQVGLGNVNNTADINKIVAYADTSRVTHRADTVLSMLPQSQITGLTAALGGKADTSDNANRTMVAATINDSLDERANDYLKNADSTDIARRTYVSTNFEAKATIRQLFTSGLIDSVKTTDTLFLGAIYPAATVDTLRVDALGAVDVTMIVEMVDSLNQSSGQTPVCTTTVTNARKLISSFDEAALLNGKILRVRFTTVGTMPKQIIISVLGHH